jgi:hypothetical protein
MVSTIKRRVTLSTWRTGIKQSDKYCEIYEHFTEKCDEEKTKAIQTKES